MGGGESGRGGRGWERVFSPYLSEGNFQSKLVSQHKQGEWGSMKGGEADGA
jgi:hypothetical protein